MLALGVAYHGLDVGHGYGGVDQQGQVAAHRQRLGQVGVCDLAFQGERHKCIPVKLGIAYLGLDVALVGKAFGDDAEGTQLFAVSG